MYSVHDKDNHFLEQKDKYIRFDWAIKRLLRNKANFGVLEGFLTVLLGEDIHILDLRMYSVHDKDNHFLAQCRNKEY